MKRLLDILVATLALAAFSPLLGALLIGIWAYDRRSPFYIAPRVGRHGKLFQMIKLRSMVANADLLGGTSTATSDRRITPLGHFIRRYKLDELTQFVNVLKGDMSLVGPRPNVPPDVARYTPTEMQLLAVRPGITDIASIVFSDEGEILAPHSDPDLAYNQLIRPGKSRLGIFYVKNASIKLDLKLLLLTAIAVVSRSGALSATERMLRGMNAPRELIEIAARKTALSPQAPPGADEVVRNLETN